MDDLQDELTAIVDGVAPPAVKKQASRLLAQWSGGVVPAPSQLARLRREVRPVLPCVRIELDGTCGWLRQHGEAHGLQVPPVGEPAYCYFVGKWEGCGGYRPTGKEET